MEQIDWDKAERSGKSAAYQSFQKTWPNGKYAAESEAKFKEALTREGAAAFKSVMDGLKYKPADAIDPAPIRGFLARYPNDPNAGEAQDQLRKAEQGYIAKFRNDGRRASAIRYVELFPEGADVAEAKEFVAGAGDDRTWIKVLGVAPDWTDRAKEIGAVKNYLEDWPEGRHVVEAKIRLKKLEGGKGTTDKVFAALGIALGLGGLWLAYAAASYVVPQIWNALPSGLDDWRKVIAEKIAPEPETPPISPEGLRRELNRPPVSKGLGAGTDLPTFEERIKRLDDVTLPNGPAATEKSRVPLDPSKSFVPPETGKTFSVNTLDAMRNITSPNVPAEGETEGEFNRRMIRKNPPSADTPSR